MKLLALDISSKTTGWSLFDDYHLSQYGSIITNTKNNSITNGSLYKFSVDIDQVIRKTNPRAVAVENIYIGKNSRSSIILAMMSGIVRAIAYKYTLREIQTIYPIEVNRYFKFSTKLKSQDRKKELVSAINKTYNLSLKLKDNDIADAIGLGAVAINKELSNLKKKYI